MNKFICIHGHFYQPPRENPWLEEIERDFSAEPDHDWNERIERECYRPNTISRLKDYKNRILNIQNNFEWISFNIGPTLIDWMARHAPETLLRIQEADRQSLARWGHGNALAQVYNHVIMPLASRHDKVTQVRWGVAHFKYYFKREPEGMWLAETAVDTVTLEILAAAGIRFTVLSPYQAHRFRESDQAGWQDVEGGRIDPTRPYICRLPSGASIALFFYDGPISRAVAFEQLLADGVRFARRIFVGFRDERPWRQLVHLATDGESYGHHSQFGDMALARALLEIRENADAQLLNYGAFLELTPPVAEVEIFEPSAWSCSHGVGRWREDCGCRLGSDPGWNQQWRRPLRAALNKIKIQFDKIFTSRGAELWADPWEVRNRYIDPLLSRVVSTAHFDPAAFADIPAALEPRRLALTLLEMQRNALLMFTSCGWFFDDISRIEPVQNLKYAARAMQLARQLGYELEDDFLIVLRAARSNLAMFGDGAQVYRRLVRPQILQLEHLLAHRAFHLALQQLRGGAALPAEDYCYTFQDGALSKSAALADSPTPDSLAVLGWTHCRSHLTGEEQSAAFAVICRADGELTCLLRACAAGEAGGAFDDLPGGLFCADESARVLPAGVRRFQPKQLFHDSCRSILRGDLTVICATVDQFSRQIHRRYREIWNECRDAGLQLPRQLHHVVEAHLQGELEQALQEPDLPAALQAAEEILQLAQQAKVELERSGLKARINADLHALLARPPDAEDEFALARGIRIIDWTRRWIMNGREHFFLDEFQNRYFERYLSTAGLERAGKLPKNELQKIYELGKALEFNERLLEQLEVSENSRAALETAPQGV